MIGIDGRELVNRWWGGGGEEVRMDGGEGVDDGDGW